MWHRSQCLGWYWQRRPRRGRPTESLPRGLALFGRELAMVGICTSAPSSQLTDCQLERQAVEQQRDASTHRGQTSFPGPGGSRSPARSRSLIRAFRNGGQKGRDAPRSRCRTPDRLRRPTVLQRPSKQSRESAACAHREGWGVVNARWIMTDECASALRCPGSPANGDQQQRVSRSLKAARTLHAGTLGGRGRTACEYERRHRACLPDDDRVHRAVHELHLLGARVHGGTSPRVSRAIEPTQERSRQRRRVRTVS